jgi:alkylation response protein AidB-like acyl-CoA dehydrogenase
MAIPEEYGGSGSSLAELIIVMEEMGSVLLCSPYFASVVLAATAIRFSRDDVAKKMWLPGIAGGEIVAALAVSEGSGRWNVGHAAVTARRRGDNWLLSGQKSYVIDGDNADVLIVLAGNSDGPSLFAVPSDAAGLSRDPVVLTDLTRRFAHVSFDNTEARLIGEVGGAMENIENALAIGGLALAAEQAGGAQRCLDQAVAYAKDRFQFGRAIGSFQAIKHKCVDMLLDVEGAKTSAYVATWLADDQSPDARVASHVAQAVCSEAFLRVATDNIQIHGGIGFTWENPAHLYLRRARVNHQLLGDPDTHREAVLRLASATQDIE